MILRIITLVAYLFAVNSLYAADYFIRLKPNTDSHSVFPKVQGLVNTFERIHTYGPTYTIKYEKAFVTLKEMGLDRVYVLSLPDNIDKHSISSIESIEGVEYIEAVPEYHFFYTPNDYSSSLSWHLNKINASQAWDQAKGSPSVVVGLVDDGMDTLHSDLRPVLWHNTAEIKGNGIDDDANGYIDDYFGWDVADNDNNPCVVTLDSLSHGTHCAGIMGAKTDNNNGIASIGFNIRIMPVKCSRSRSSGLYNAYRGVEYAMENGARVISMSWGGSGYSRTYQALFDLAYSRNIICVAAAGNDYSNTIRYPAAYNRVICVGSTDAGDRKSNFSNYGSWVDVMAPGSSIYSTLPGNSYGNKSGTSMACPLVSGLCALMLSKNPTLSNAAIESCLKSTCDNIDALNTSYTGNIGSGRINAYKALLCVKAVNADFTVSRQYVCPADTVRFYDKSTAGSNTYLWSFAGGTPAVSSLQNPIVRYNAPGIYKVKLIVNRGTDSDTIEKTDYINVGKPSVSFSGVQNINRGELGTVKATFTGLAPWTLIYTDGKNTDTIKNIQSNPYYIMVQPDSSRIYKPVKVYTNLACSGNTSDSALVNVNQNSGVICDSSLRIHMSFGGSGADEAYDMVAANDSIIYIAGSTSARGAGGTDAYVAKLNIKGRILWYRTLGNQYNDLFYGITADKNQNLYLSGNSYPSSSSSDKMMLIAKVSSNGTLLWQKQITGSSIEYMKACVVSKINPNWLYFIGPAVSNSFGGEDFVLVKCDTSGNVLWQKKYGSSLLDRPQDMQEDDKGNLYMVGISNNKHALFAVDSAGAVKYSYTYSDGANNYQLSASCVVYDNHLYVSGITGNSPNYHLYITKLKLDGQVVWSKKYYSGSTYSTTWYSRIVMQGNNFLAAWTTNVAPADGFIIKVDSSGNLINYSSIGDGTNSYSISSIASLSDNSICYAGTSASEAMLGKLNCKMKNLCFNKNSAVSVSAMSLIRTTLSVSAGAAGLSIYPTISSNLYTNIAPSVLCKSKDYNTPYICDSAYRFHVSFGGFGDDQAYAMATYQDTIVYIAGKTSSVGAGGYDAFVAKLTTSGKVYWFKTLGGSAEDGHLAIDVDRSGNLYCAGYTYSNVSDRAACMIKMDANGNIRWKRYYNGNAREYLYDVIVSANDEDIYFTGYALSYSMGSEDAAIFKVDSTGVVKWAKQFGTGQLDRPHQLLEDDSLNIYVLGITQPRQALYHDALIFKIKPDASIVFSKYYTTSNVQVHDIITGGAIWHNRYIYSLVQVYSGASGNNTIMKTDMNGKLQWTKQISLPASIDRPKMKIVDDKLVLTSYGVVSGKTYGFIVSLDSNANILSSKQVGTSNNVSLTNMAVNRDLSILYTGYQQISNNQIVLGKTNCRFDNSCLFSNASAIASSYLFTENALSFSSQNFNYPITLNHTAGTYNNQILNYNCKSPDIKPVITTKCKLHADWLTTHTCFGDTSRFMDMSLDSNGYNVKSWNWDFGDNTTASGTSMPAHVYKSKGTYTVTLIVTSEGNSQICADTLTRPYIISDSLKLLLMTPDTLVCKGDSFQVRTPEVLCGKWPYTYRWSPVAGVSDPALADPYFAPKTSTTYTLLVTDAAGQTVKDSFTITVDLMCCKSKARFKTKAENVCLGDTAYFINTSTYDAGSVYFEWRFTGADRSSYIGQTPPGILFNGTGPKTVQLYLSDICANDTLKQDIYINPLPVAHAGKDTTLCGPDTITIGSESLGRNIYRWIPSAGLDDAFRSDPQARVTADSRYILHVKDEYGCSNTDTINIDIKPGKIFIANDSTVCSGDSIVLSISQSGQYLWSTGSKNKQITVKQPGTYWGQLQGKCIGRDTVTISIDSEKIFIANDSSMCQGDNIILSIPKTGQYLWSTGATGRQITVTQAGTYWGELKGKCPARDTVSITVNPLPAFSLGADKLLCKDPIVLKPSITYNKALYLWSNGSSASTLPAAGTGTYLLTVTDTLGCSYKDTIVVKQGTLPELPPIPDGYICNKANYTVSFTPLPGHRYEWFDLTSLNTKVIKDTGSRYWLRTITDCGDSTVYFRVKDTSCHCDVWIPNAMSPNADGHNDYFKPVSSCPLTEYRFRIYSRWGELLFESENPDASWDGNYMGKAVPQGIYLYIAEYRKNMLSTQLYEIQSKTFIVIR